MRLMTGDVIKKVVQIFASEATRIYGNILDAVILYGSCARGDFEPDSDIDILILLNVSPDKICEERKKIRSLSDRLDLEYDVVLAPVVQSTQVYEKYLSASVYYQNVKKEGVKVA